jgi:hypothetical protein
MTQWIRATGRPTESRRSASVIRLFQSGTLLDHDAQIYTLVSRDRRPMLG